MQVVALFGEAEKGTFQSPYVLQKLPELMDQLGHPPQESEGMFFAIQAILYNRKVFYFRVSEEGFSRSEYFLGLKYLQDRQKVEKLNAICLPGVGDKDILDASRAACHVHKSFLITSKKDLYDYLTSSC